MSKKLLIFVLLLFSLGCDDKQTENVDCSPGSTDFESCTAIDPLCYFYSGREGTLSDGVCSEWSDVQNFCLLSENGNHTGGGQALYVKETDSGTDIMLLNTNDDLNGWERIDPGGFDWCDNPGL